MLNCGWESQFATDIDTGYSDLVSGKVELGCREDGHLAWKVSDVILIYGI